MSDAAAQQQGKIVGVIIPPPDIRAVVDKTAQFVAKNGKNFETKILNSADGKTPKFNFMRPFDPYHAYYEMKIRHFEEGKDGQQEGQNAAATAAAATAAEGSADAPGLAHAPKAESLAARATIFNPVARILQDIARDRREEQTGAGQPDISAHEFCPTLPVGVSPLEVEIIKLAAIYAAVNGKDFLTGLAQREQRNPQFDFLRPTHILYRYFQALCEMYGKVLQRFRQGPSYTGTSSSSSSSSSSNSNGSSSGSHSFDLDQSKQAALEQAVRRWKVVNDENDRKAQQSMADSGGRTGLILVGEGVYS